MKVLHVVGGDLSGGAARGAYWLHQGLKELGIDSKILIQSSNIKKDDIIPLANTKSRKVQNKLKIRLDQLPAKFYRNKSDSIFSPGLFGNNLTKLTEYKEADIIHAHWINNAMLNINTFSKIRKPIVWTFRDMWPFTGGCHYTMGCQNYKIGCGHCKALGSGTKYDLSRLVIRIKKRNFKENIYPITISNWLKECAKESYLFRDYYINVIHNGVDTSEFVPVNKQIAREILNLSQDRKIILFGAHNIRAKYKGYNKLLEVLKTLNKKAYFFLFFGRLDRNIEEEIKRYGVEYKSLGFLSDDISLKIVYSAADVFLALSIQEAFGKTLIESMACGTPVVCFNATGPKDIVEHKKNGYLAKPFESSDLVNGINWVLDNQERLIEFEKNARQKVMDKFEIKKIAKQYKELYEDILN